MTHPFGIGDFASMGVPGGNPLQGAGLAETMELVRKAWSSFALPPNMAPTVDPDEIARRIAELRAVEQWLVMNLTMLRGSIQALEIQQTTLATLRAFGVTGAATSERSATTGSAGVGAGAAAHTATGTSAGADSRAGAGAGSATETPDVASPQPGIGALNPVAWWEALQRQFGEVASVALASMPAAAAASAAAASAAAAGASGSARSARTGPAGGEAASSKRGASGSGARPGASTKAAGGRKRAPGASSPSPAARGTRGKPSA